MPQIIIPLTTYQIRENRAATPFGSPATLSVQETGPATHRVLIRVPVDKIPVGAVITSAVVQFWTAGAKSGATPIRIRPISTSWKSSVTWNNQPTLGAIITTTSINDPAADTLYSFSVTAWAGTRNRNGLALDTTLGSIIPLRGSSAAINQPVMVVDYYTPNDKPVNLSPQGGAVSVPTPILSYTGDRDMDHQQVQYSTDGTVPGIVFDSGSVPATAGRYEPTGGEPVLAASEGTYWRVMTTGGGGESPWSEWVFYTYEPIVAPVIDTPPSVTDDGSPTLSWTVADQVSWQAELRNGSEVRSYSAWDVNVATRDWTPSAGVPLPDGNGLMVLRITDSITPRVAAEGAPVWAEVTQPFTTALGSEDPGITGLAVSFDEPTPIISGTRALGIPDEIALMRDGVVVTIWDADGIPRQWAPGADFFDGTTFVIPDYTADLRKPHTWSVLIRPDGEDASEPSDEITATLNTGSVWIVDPRTGDKVEVLGNNAVPVVSQATEEASVLHTPVHGNLVVEPVRRRLVRTTKAGGIEGLVLNADEYTLDEWALSDSSMRYRLIFGKVNWPIIFGDYSPSDIFYPHPDPECDDTVVLISLNWWQRLED